MYISSTKEITKEQFEYLKNCNVKDFYAFIENEAINSPFPPMGYGFSNPNVFCKDGKYFIIWQRWDSCD